MYIALLALAVALLAGAEWPRVESRFGLEGRVGEGVALRGAVPAQEPAVEADADFGDVRHVHVATNLPQLGSTGPTSSMFFASW